MWIERICKYNPLIVTKLNSMSESTYLVLKISVSLRESVDERSRLSNCLRHR